MDAVVLVGGGGTRLRPLTYAIPKPLIPVLNRPLISHLILNLHRGGVQNVVLAASASDRRIEEALGDGSDLGVHVTYCYEREPLGSGLAVKQAAAPVVGAFFVCNGDVLYDLDVGAMLACHQERAAVMSIFLAPVGDPSAYGIADVDATGRITRFVEKPPPGQAPSNLANAGTWIFEQAVLESIPDQKMDGSIERLVMPALIAEGCLVLGYSSDAYWMDVGTPERYLQIHADLLGGRIPAWLPESMRGGRPFLGADSEVWPDAVIESNVVLGSRCRVGGLVQIKGPSALGDGCAVREKAVIERSVCWSDVRIGAAAVVRDSIIGRGCLIGDGAVVVDAVLADGARVKRGARLAPGVRLEPGEEAG